MRIRETIYKNMNELPGYDLVGYSEISIPMYEIKLHTLVLTRSTIPVVEEFVLNFYNEGLKLDEIELMLGLDKEIINQAWAGLQQRDYISFIDKHVTEAGKEYIKDNDVKELENFEFSIMVDSISGKILRVNNQLMNAANIKKIGGRTLKALLDVPSVDTLDFKATKRVFNSYKKENPDYYSGELIEILDIEKKSTKFKRIEILIFENNDNDIRILAYDGYNRIPEYEEKLIELDEKGIKLIKYNYGNYFESKVINDIDMKVNKDKNKKSIALQSYNDNLSNYLNGNDNIIIILPLVSMCEVNRGFITVIEKSLERGKKIDIIISGNTYVSEHEKKIYSMMDSLKSKYKNLSIRQIPEYINKMIIEPENKRALISLYEKRETRLKASKIGILEKAFEITGELFNEINNEIEKLYNINDLVKFDLSNINRQWLKEKLELVIRLVRDVDIYMNERDGIGWIADNDIPNISQLRESPLSERDTQFSVFIENLNKSFVESLDNNIKINAQDKRYFWHKFRRDYPQLQKILDKIRTYRNKNKHLALTNENEKKYQKYLKEDLNGYMPKYIKNGYLILQVKILEQLESDIKNLIIDLKQ